MQYFEQDYLISPHLAECGVVGAATFGGGRPGMERVGYIQSSDYLSDAENLIFQLEKKKVFTSIFTFIQGLGIIELVTSQ